MPISQPWLPPNSVLHGIEPYEWNQETPVGLVSRVSERRWDIR